MAAQAGNAALIEWIHSAGTVTISTDFRTSGLNETINLIDESAGADTDAVHINGLKSFSFSIDMVRQTGGTALEAVMAVGTGGSVVYSPEGTASANRKYTLPATVQTFNTSHPYQDIVGQSVTFQGNGAVARSAY